MTKYLSSPFESTDEQRLRATLHDETLIPVDTEHAWKQVALRCSLPHVATRQSQLGAFQQRRVNRSPRSMFQRARFVAVLACVALTLMATTFAIASVGGVGAKIEFLLKHGGVLPNEYQTIQQKQQSNGVTIMFTEAYADANRINLNFTMQLSPTISKEYIGAFPPQTIDLVINGQQERLNRQKPLNCSGYIPQRSTSCNLTLVPAHPLAAKNLDITWNVTQVTLVKLGKLLKNASKLSGHWHFHFTIPVHSK